MIFMFKFRKMLLIALATVFVIGLTLSAPVNPSQVQARMLLSNGSPISGSAPLPATLATALSYSIDSITSISYHSVGNLPYNATAWQYSVVGTANTDCMLDIPAITNTKHVLTHYLVKSYGAATGTNGMQIKVYDRLDNTCPIWGDGIPAAAPLNSTVECKDEWMGTAGAGMRIKAFAGGSGCIATIWAKGYDVV
jgi:hypothetical protein